MNTSNNTIKDYLLAKLNGFVNWVSKHAKIIMPVVLLVCVVVTVIVSINASRSKDETEEEAVTTEGVEVATNLAVIPDVPLEQGAVPEINELINTYYTAMVEGDTDTMGSLIDHLDDTEILRVQETSKYIEGYPVVDVYTKIGPRENTYIVYVYNEIKFYDYEKAIPGMKTFFICVNEEGNFYINEDGEESESDLHYIREVTLQDDVVDLNNKASVAYNDMLAEDENLAKFLLDLDEEVDKNLGEALARAEGSGDTGETEGTETETPEGENAEGEAEAAEPETIVTKVKATDVVNIRTSDSETADKLGKAAVGDEFTLLEERGNGWSKIEYEGGEAFIKSEFLEPAEVEVAVADGGQENEAEDTPAATDNASAAVTGTVTVKENVRIRSSASETAEKLGTAYVGEKLELIMKQADGWTKIKYNGRTAYVKSDYVE